MSESLNRYLKEFKEKIKDADDKLVKDIDLYWEQTIKLFDDDNDSFMKTVLRISCVYKKHWGNLYFDKLDIHSCLLYTSPSPRDQRGSRMPSSA